MGWAALHCSKSSAQLAVPTCGSSKQICTYSSTFPSVFQNWDVCNKQHLWMAGREMAFCLLSRRNQRILTFKAIPAPAGRSISEHHPVSLQTNSEVFETHSWDEKEWLKLIWKALWSRGFLRRLHKYPWDDIFMMYKEGQVKQLPFFFFLFVSTTVTNK